MLKLILALILSLAGVLVLGPRVIPIPDTVSWQTKDGRNCG